MLPVTSEESAGSLNRIPEAYAGLLAQALGGEVRHDVVKVAGVHNTDASQADRSANKQVVEGGIDPDVQYVLVDDTFTSGDTLMTYLGHMLERGATVSAVSTVADSRNQNYIKPRPQDIEKVVAKVGKTRIQSKLNFDFPLANSRVRNSSASQTPTPPSKRPAPLSAPSRSSEFLRVQKMAQDAQREVQEILASKGR